MCQNQLKSLARNICIICKNQYSSSDNTEGCIICLTTQVFALYNLNLLYMTQGIDAQVQENCGGRCCSSRLVYIKDTLFCPFKGTMHGSKSKVQQLKFTMWLYVWNPSASSNFQAYNCNNCRSHNVRHGKCKSHCFVFCSKDKLWRRSLSDQVSETRQCVFSRG